MADHAAMKKRAGGRLGTTLLGKWTLDRLIDIGGMGAVFGATHRNGKQVAIKILHPEFAADEEIRTRFLREGYVANKVGHPGAVSVLDDDTTEDGSVFLVMELLEGESLEGRIARNGGRLDAAGLLAIIDPVLDVLASAHNQGIIHRDIKPANIFITRAGEAKVLDFGLAHIRERTSKSLTRTGMVMGTSTYMPPEQARAQWKMVDARSDIWAVGATMFRALTGRHVHHGAGTQVERMLAAMSQHAVPLATLAPSVSPGVSLLVDRALAFQRSDRWADAKAMQKALRYAYRELENQGAPPLASASIRRDDELPAMSVRLDDSHLDEQVVSVMVDTSLSHGDSIVVEISDEFGTQQRYQLDKAGSTAADDLMEVAAPATVMDRPKRPAGS